MDWVEMSDYWQLLYALEKKLVTPVRWLGLLIAVALLWLVHGRVLPRACVPALLFYALVSAMVTAFWLTVPEDMIRSSEEIRTRKPKLRRELQAMLFLLLLADAGFTSFLVFYSGGLDSELYLVYGLLALKAALTYPAFHGIIIGPFLFGPLYVYTLYLSNEGLFFLVDRHFLLRYGLLFALILVTAYLAHFLDARQQTVASLARWLTQQAQDLEHKTRTLQQTATELRNRVLELRSLQEGAKAINSDLALENVLRFIVNNASQVSGGARCTVGLLSDDEQSVVILAASNADSTKRQPTRFALGEGIAGWVVAHGKSVLINDVSTDPRFLPLNGDPIASIISVPLIAGGRALGALTATSPEPNAFTEEHRQLLSAFADQGALAVKNARLYRQLVQEQQHTARLYQDVREKSNELEAILRDIGDGVIVADPELRLLMMNPVAARIFGLRPFPTSGIPLSELLTDEARAPLTELLTKTLNQATNNPPAEKAQMCELTLRSSDHSGNERTYQALASLVLSAEGQPRGVVTVLRDITGQKELERMKSNFLSVVSHELKTPLHSIKGFVDIILMGKTGPINELQRDFLSTVKEQTDQLQNLINDLLEFSRLESGQVRLRIEGGVSLAHLADRVIERLSPMANEGNLCLTSLIPEDFPLIEGDQVRLEQVLTNLVHNALKFTPSGGQVVIQGEDLGNWVKITVSDTGIGIPTEELERIFDRFYQVDSGSTRPYRGTGLGLTICKHIVEHHQGRIWAESGPGQGSRFHFVLPKRLAPGDDFALDFTTLPARTP